MSSCVLITYHVHNEVIHIQVTDTNATTAAAKVVDTTVSWSLSLTVQENPRCMIQKSPFLIGSDKLA